jgi:hypothetical protein
MISPSVLCLVNKHAEFLSPPDDWNRQDHLVRFKESSKREPGAKKMCLQNLASKGTVFGRG